MTPAAPSEVRSIRPLVSRPDIAMGIALRVLRTWRQWWWALIAWSVLIAGLTVLFIESLPRIYSSQALVLVNQAEYATDVSITDVLGSERLAGTYAEISLLTPTLERAAKIMNEPGVTADTLRPKILARQTDIKNGRIEVLITDRTRRTQIFRIIATDSDPDRASRIANAVGAAVAETTAEFQIGGQPVATTASETIAQALPARYPVWPTTTLEAALALFLGPVLATVFLVSLTYFWERILHTRDVERLGVPVVGIISHEMVSTKPSLLRRIRRIPGRLKRQPAGYGEDPYPTTSLAAGLAFMASTHRSSVILVTGGSPHEGSGKAAAAVGSALARFSRRVLLIDGDFGKPSLHLQFGISNEAGLAAALREPEVSFGRFTTRIEERLFVLPAGDMPRNATLLLNSQRIGYVLRALAAEFDFVVVSGAPAVDHADTLMWAALTDEVLIVGSRGKITRRDLARSIKAVTQTNRPIWGVVLTEG